MLMLGGAFPGQGAGMFPLFRWLRSFRFLAQGQQGHTAEKQAHTGQLLPADRLMQQKDAPAGGAQRLHQGQRGGMMAPLR